VLHVGCKPRARGGIAQRLKNHLAGQSSFVATFLRRKPALLRRGYKFKFIGVSNARTRMLLEAYAVGHLCPRHIGHG
jgi:hypothetical protein